MVGQAVYDKIQKIRSRGDLEKDEALKRQATSFKSNRRKSLRPENMMGISEHANNILNEIL